MRWMYDSPPLKMCNGQNYSYTNILGAASSMSSVTLKRSENEKEG